MPKILSDTHCTIAEAADWLGVSKPRVHALIRKGRLAHVWDYGQKLVKTKSLVEYARSRLDHIRRESSRVESARCSQS